MAFPLNMGSRGFTSKSFQELMILLKTALLCPVKYGSTVFLPGSSNLEGPTISRTISLCKLQGIPVIEQSFSSRRSAGLEASINASATSAVSLRMATQLLAEFPKMLKLLSITSAISATAFSARQRKTHTSFPGRKHSL